MSNITKKNVLFCTNCQGHSIIKILKLSEEFTRNYNCDIIENWILLKNSKDDESLREARNKMKNANIFIYQPLKKEHGNLSTETEEGLLKYLKNDTKIISLPYIYNNGFWPFFKAVGTEDDFYPGLSNRKFVNGEALYEIYKEHHSQPTEDLIIKFNDSDLNFKHVERFQNSLNILKNNEKSFNTTIKVSKYIEDNYKKHRLFLSKDHPTTRIFLYCTNELLKLLDIKLLDNKTLETELDENYCNLSDSEYKRHNNKWPITKQCALELGLEYHDDEHNEATLFFSDMLRKIFERLFHPF